MITTSPLVLSSYCLHLTPKAPPKTHTQYSMYRTHAHNHNTTTHTRPSLLPLELASSRLAGAAPHPVTLVEASMRLAARHLLPIAFSMSPSAEKPVITSRLLGIFPAPLPSAPPPAPRMTFDGISTLKSLRFA